MRLVIRPMMDSGNEIDVTHQLVKVIAEELWRRYGGNDVLNWMEAQWHIEALFERGSAVRVLPLSDLVPGPPSPSRPNLPRAATSPAGARRGRRDEPTRLAGRRAAAPSALEPV